MNGSAVFIRNAARFPLFFKRSAPTDRRETDDVCRMHPTSCNQREDSSARSALPPEVYSSMNASINCREANDACRMHPTFRSRRVDSSARSALPPETHSGMNTPTDRRETDSTCRSNIPQSVRGFSRNVGHFARDTLRRARFSDDGLICDSF